MLSAEDPAATFLSTARERINSEHDFTTFKWIGFKPIKLPKAALGRDQTLMRLSC